MKIHFVFAVNKPGLDDGGELMAFASAGWAIIPLSAKDVARMEVSESWASSLP